MPNDASGKLLLVIDDDELMREMIAATAGAHGFTCLDADSQEAAERIFEAHSPDIIVLDLLMPGRDGVEWIGELARRGTAAQLILHSGCDRRVLDAAALLAKNLGLKVLGILEKPFVVLDFLRLLNRDVPASAPTPESPAIHGDEIRAGIAKEQLVIHFQPQVLLSDGRWTGMEALVRWNHPDYGLMLPGAFVQAAESAGLGLDLTREVLRLALADHSRIVDATRFDGYLSINLPGTALVDPDFPEQVYKQVMRCGFNPERLVFELTETAMAKDLDMAIEILTRLRLKGFSLSIDDFGTGYSSYELLHQLPFNELKVEMQFVRAARFDSVARAIVENSVMLARQLGITAVAEGVESQADWVWLRALGCDRAQGYFFSRPISSVDIAAWSDRWRSLGSQASESTAISGSHSASRS
jgi:EAL domain-containing protein (putative c-di-GMP-specific phosphodiesterase class I)/ActR/RegA family two-component response regulator